MPVGMHRPKPSKWKNVWPFLAILVIVPALGWAAATALSRQQTATVNNAPSPAASAPSAAAPSAPAPGASAIPTIPDNPNADVSTGGSYTASVDGSPYVIDDASVAYVRRHGVTNLSRGVLRTRDLAGGEGTRIAKHLRFSSVSLANPAGTAVLSSMATQMAIQHSLEQMQQIVAEQQSQSQSQSKVGSSRRTEPG